jgi:hypothetical protein
MGWHIPVHLILFALPSLTLIWGVGSLGYRAIILIVGPGCGALRDLEWSLLGQGISASCSYLSKISLLFLPLKIQLNAERISGSYK